MSDRKDSGEPGKGFGSREAAGKGGEYRDRLSLLVFKSAFGLIAGAAVIVIVLWVCVRRGLFCETPGECAGAVDEFLPLDLFYTILPIVSGWIGVVLGFYFSDRAAENRGEQVIQAGGYKRLSDRLGSVDVKQAMIPVAQIKKIILKYDADGRILNKFSELKEAVREKGYTRAPMFDVVNGELILRHIAHESVIYRYEAMTRENGDDPKDKSIQNFVDDPLVKELIDRSTVFISRDATLQQAKEAMEAAARCQDVFVTHDGRAGSPIEGWLPNVWILRQSVRLADD